MSRKLSLSKTTRSVSKALTGYTSRRLAQRIRTVLDVAKSEGRRSGENAVTGIRDARILPALGAIVWHHDAMP